VNYHVVQNFRVNPSPSSGATFAAALPPGPLRVIVYGTINLMKNLIIVGGTMGVGKTAACRELQKTLPRNVFLDGD